MRLGYVVVVLGLLACEPGALGIQAASGTASDSDRVADPAGARLPVFPPGPSGLLGVTPTTLRQYAGQFGGRGLLVNFWASFCGSCKRELPMLKTLRDDFADAGIGLLLISADAPEDRDKAVALLREAGLPAAGHYTLAPVGAFKAELEPRWRGALPATMLLDTTGRVRHFWNGPVLADEVRPVLQGFLAGEDIDGMTDLAAEPAR